MNNSELLDLVLDSIKELMNDDVSFSAWDVTKRVRSKTDENVYHVDVRSLVHKLMTLCEQTYSVIDNGKYKVYTPDFLEDEEEDENMDYPLSKGSNTRCVQDWCDQYQEWNVPTKLTVHNSEPEKTAQEKSEDFWDNLLPPKPTTPVKECKKCDEGCDKKVCKKLETKSEQHPTTQELLDLIMKLFSK